MANDELYTPKHIFDALGVEFDLDVCAPVGGVDWIPAKKSFNEIDDGLAQEWVGKVWMNPPFSQATKWVDKWLDHGNGFALVVYSKSAWFNRLWNSPAKGISLPSNIKFITTENKPFSIWMPVGLWAISETNITTLEMSGLGRIR